MAHPLPAISIDPSNLFSLLFDEGNLGKIPVSLAKIGPVVYEELSSEAKC